MIVDCDDDEAAGLTQSTPSCDFACEVFCVRIVHGEPLLINMFLPTLCSRF